MKSLVLCLVIAAFAVCGTASAQRQVVFSTGGYRLMDSSAASKYAVFYCPDEYPNAFDYAATMDYSNSADWGDALPWNTAEQGTTDMLKSLLDHQDIYLSYWDTNGLHDGNDLLFEGSGIPDLTGYEITDVEVTIDRVTDNPGLVDTYFVELLVYGEAL